MFSGTLLELGYEADVIEEKVFLQTEEGEEVVHPDIILTSPSQEHSLIIDVKSTKIDKDQLERYLILEDNEKQLFLQGLIEDTSIQDLRTDITLSSFTDLCNAGIPSSIAVVHFDISPSSGLFIKNCKDNKITNEDTADAFPINVHPEYPLPTGHYPFDIAEGDQEEMVSTVFMTVMELSIKSGEFTIEDVAKNSHPYWEVIGDGKQDELKQRVEKVFLELIDAGLEDHLEKIAGTQGQRWKTTSKTFQAIQRRIDYYVQEVTDQLPQARLNSDAWSADDEN
jgi:hypothetical protein